MVKELARSTRYGISFSAIQRTKLRQECRTVSQVAGDLTRFFQVSWANDMFSDPGVMKGCACRRRSGRRFGVGSPRLGPDEGRQPHVEFGRVGPTCELRCVCLRLRLVTLVGPSEKLKGAISVIDRRLRPYSIALHSMSRTAKLICENIGAAKQPPLERSSGLVRTWRLSVRVG